MAKLILNDIEAGYLTHTAYNANNTLIETALENTLSRDGATPNQMGANLDMNSNRILNLPVPLNDNEPARLVDVQNSVAGGAANLISYTPSGIGAVTTTVQSKLGESVSVLDFGAVGDGVTDDTTALNNAYAYAKLNKKSLFLPSSYTYRFISQLLWDGSVDIIGENSEYTKLYKDGNFTGIKITGAAQQSRFSDFELTSSAADLTGHGIWVDASSHLHLNRVGIFGMGGHGLYLHNATTPTGFLSKYTNIMLISNGGDGLHISQNHYASYFENIDSRANTGIGINILSGNDYHTGLNVYVQQNLSNGFQLAAQQCNFEIYGESNTGKDIVLTATSLRNKITAKAFITYPDDFEDLGTNNIAIDLSGSAGYYSPKFSQLKKTTNAVGAPVVISGGAAGGGAAAKAGGALFVLGGDAAGTGNESGGAVYVEGGPPVGTGLYGTTIIGEHGGYVLVGTPTAIDTNAQFHLARGGINFPATAVLSTNANTLDDYQESGAGTTVTLTGVTTTVTGTAHWTKVGNLVTVDIPTLSGTSNATTKTITGLPADIFPATAKSALCIVSDNGGAEVAARVDIGTNGVLTVYSTTAGGVWTAAGTAFILKASFSFTLK